jgi:hypothetical protein
VDLKGASQVRLRLFNLPEGSNFDALMYEDQAPYELLCYTGDQPGDQDKVKDCDPNPSKSYFILVNRGPRPEGGSYNMSLMRR